MVVFNIENKQSDYAVAMQLLNILEMGNPAPFDFDKGIKEFV